LIEGTGSASYPSCFTLSGRAPHYLVDINLGGLKSWYGHEARKICCPVLRMEPHSTGHLAPLLYLYIYIYRLFVTSLLGIVIAIMLSCKGNAHKTGNFEFGDILRAHCVDMTEAILREWNTFSAYV
jgi:hypothetical protein